MSPNGTPNRNVGVAIALHRKQQQQRFQEQQSEVQQTTTVKRRSQQQRLHQRPWWQDLFYGVSLYMICIYLPPLYDFWVQNVASLLLGSHDAEITDLALVLIISLGFAILRITLVTYWIDIDSSQHVQAMVRCKSIHLLSSAYPQSLTPRNSVKSIKSPLMMQDPDNFETILTLPALSSSGGTGMASLTMKPRYAFEEQEQHENLSEQRTYLPPTISEEMPVMKRSDSWIESTWKQVRRQSEQAFDRTTQLRLHAAPRHATAVFRALYCFLSCSLAWNWFGSSDFWPFWVGGSGSTQNCWNLKGSPGMEEDYDDMNGYLKLFYLLQASYHLHSGAFHVLTILWARRKSPKEARLPPFTSYWRSLLQHIIAILLIAGSYVFASTRRLGAIGSFALDASSLWLHVLQIAMNAPTPWSSSCIKVFHRGVVIPFFVYCRFFLWPFVVWQSAWRESEAWLQQMESTLFPGIYRAMILAFTALTAILLVLNMVLLKRLLFHPHLKRVLEKKESSSEPEQS